MTNTITTGHDLKMLRINSIFGELQQGPGQKVWTFEKN